MVLIYSITTFEELKDFYSKFKHVILRFGASWCVSCSKTKQPINVWIQDLDLKDTVLLDIDFESYESDPEFVEMINVSKLPTFYCKDKFVITGTDLEKIKTSILLLESVSEDF
jgi:thiol:disulfide interchange protein